MSAIWQPCVIYNMQCSFDRTFKALSFWVLRHIDGLMKNCGNSIANTLELLQSCTKPSIWLYTVWERIWSCSGPRRPGWCAEIWIWRVCKMLPLGKCLFGYSLGSFLAHVGFNANDYLSLIYTQRSVSFSLRWHKSYMERSSRCLEMNTIFITRHTKVIVFSPCVLVCLSRCMSGRFNHEGLVPHKQYFAGT